MSGPNTCRTAIDFPRHAIAQRVVMSKSQPHGDRDVGQYYYIVNPAKRQYLNPHKFGCGLKLMEFSNSRFGPQQALCILLAKSNGQGGGDLSTNGLTEAEIALIGSWAGDSIYVAGDYMEPWDGVPKDLKGKTYVEKETVYDRNGRSTKRKKKVTHTFGKRIDRATGKEEDNNETLYSAAATFFEDISDKIMSIVAKGEHGYHPWAAVDATNDGWRQVPEWGVLPQKAPKKPIGGRKAWLAYKKSAKSQTDMIVEEMKYLLLRNPELADDLFDKISEVVEEVKSEANKARLGC